MWNGEHMNMGNTPDIDPGPGDTFQSYDLPWANASNTPFRLHKRWTHEGGISTPFIMNWPSNSSEARLLHKPAHIVDIAATIYDVAGAAYPDELHGNSITPLEGESFLGVFDGAEFTRQAPICWEHEGNRAVRMCDWKLVSEGNTRWELYNMAQDRTELNDLSESESGRVAEMTAVYEEWAARIGALPWPVGTGGTASPRVGTKHIHDVG